MKKSKMLKVIATILMLTFMIQMVPFSAIAAGDEITEILDPESIITEIPYDTTSDESPETKEIVSEETAKRSENEKHFKLEDGSFVIAQYPDAVHYEDENGNWVDIDNTLIAEEATGANDFDGYTNKDNDFNVKLAEDGKDQLLRIEEDNLSISMKLDEEDAAQSFIAVENNNNVATITDDMSVEEKNDQMMQPDKLTSKAEYSNILPGIDIEYTVQSNRVKEYIVVNERRNEYVFSFELELGNLVVCENEDGSISLMTSEGEEKYVIPAPYMFDANEQYSDAVSYAITNIGSGKYTLIVTADVEWINDDNTALPVKIDPTIETVDSTPGITDTFVADYGEKANENFISFKQLFLGTNSAYGNADIYVKWTNPASLPGSYVFSSAKLKYFTVSTINNSDVSIGVYQISSSWDSANISGINRPNNNTTPIDIIPSSTIIETSCLEIDITDLIYDSINNNDSSINSNGIVIKTIGETDSAMCFASSRYDEDAEKLPVLTIYYQNQKGIEANYSYLPIDCGNAGTAYVNIFNGDVAFIHNTINTGLININHIYNTYMTYTNSSGKSVEQLTTGYKNCETGIGWKMSVQDLIVPISSNELKTGIIDVSTQVNTPYAYIYNDEYGTNIYLLKEDNNVFRDQQDLGYALTVNSDNYILDKLNTDGTGGWSKTFKIASNEQFTYGPRKMGYITKYTEFTIDSDNDRETVATTDYSYVGSKVASKLKDITYNDGDDYASFMVSSATNQLQTISHDEREINFTYGSNETIANNLYHINDSLLGRTSFNYNTANRLISVIAPDGNELTIVYVGDSGKVDYVVWKESSTATPVNIDFTFNRDETIVHYYGFDGIDGSSENSTSIDDTYLSFLFDENGICNCINFKNNNVITSEKGKPYSLRGITGRSINAPEMNQNWYIKDGQLIATPSFDYNSDISEMYATSSEKNTISLSNDSYNGGTSYLVTINKTGDSIRNRSYLSKQVVLEAGQHTFSAYVKNKDALRIDILDENNDVINRSYGSISLSLGFYNNGTNNETTEPEIISSISTEETDDWTKLTLNFTTDVQDVHTLYIKFNDGKGSVLVDNVTIDNEYLYWPTTFIDKGISSGFEDTFVTWEVSSDNTYQRVTSTENYANNSAVVGVEPNNVYEGMYALKIAGEDDKEKSVHYIHYLNSTNLPAKGFTLSGWGKINNAIPENDEDYGFELFAYYVYYEEVGDNLEMRTKSIAIPFDPSSTDWQYVSQTFTLPEVDEASGEIYSITFGALYKNAEGNAYFDNIELLPVTE